MNQKDNTFEQTVYDSPTEKDLSQEWYTADGRTLTFGEMEDGHLLNVGGLLKYRLKIHAYLPPSVTSTLLDLIGAVSRIVSARGFDPKKLGSSQIPFEKNGAWYVFDHDECVFREVDAPPPGKDLLASFRKVVCECGAEKLKLTHSHWCPKHPDRA